MSERYEVGQDHVGSGGPDGSIDFDCLFELLSDERRRYALYCFTERSDSTVTFESLVEDLVALERRVSSQCSRREVEISLQHKHLPKLSEMGVVEYASDRSEVTYQGGPRVQTWVERVREAELE